MVNIAVHARVLGSAGSPLMHRSCLAASSPTLCWTLPFAREMMVAPVPSFFCLETKLVVRLVKFRQAHATRRSSGVVGSCKNFLTLPSLCCCSGRGAADCEENTVSTGNLRRIMRRSVLT